METRKKGSHLNIEERRQIAILDKEGWSPYAIGKKLKRAHEQTNQMGHHYINRSRLGRTRHLSIYPSRK